MDEIIKKLNTLDTEKKQWSKLNKYERKNKLADYSQTLVDKKIINNKRRDELNVFLTKCISDKKLQKNTSVKFDISKQEILDIPNLQITQNKFILKREKRQCVLNNLTPKKNRKKNDI